MCDCSGLINGTMILNIAGGQLNNINNSTSNKNSNKSYNNYISTHLKKLYNRYFRYRTYFAELQPSFKSDIDYGLFDGVAGGGGVIAADMLSSSVAL